jgi:hypothetical protein
LSLVEGVLFLMFVLQKRNNFTYKLIIGTHSRLKRKLMQAL